MKKSREKTTPTDTANKNMIIWSAVIALVIIVIIVSVMKSRNEGYGAPWKTYSNLLYHVSLDYPSHWKQSKDNEDRYEGRDGFFQIGLISGVDKDIDSVARDEAYHILKPYGSVPVLRNLNIAGQQSRLILPSEDQNPDIEGQTAVILELPQELTISESSYRYLILWSDKKNIDEIAATISLQGLTSPIKKEPETQLLEDITSETETPQDEDGFSERDLKLTSIEQGEQGAHVEAKNYVITSLEPWEELWNTLHGNESSAIPIPDVDFSKKMIIASFAGKEPTGGYKVEIEKIFEKENAVEVVVSFTRPVDACVVSDTLTSPYHIVSVNKVEKVTSYLMKDDVKECEE